MSGISVLSKFLMASSLAFLPIPLQFQEMIFIICVSDGLPWSLGSGFSASLILELAVFPSLVGYPEVFLCRSPAPFFPCPFSGLL